MVKKHMAQLIFALIISAVAWAVMNKARADGDASIDAQDTMTNQQLIEMLMRATTEEILNRAADQISENRRDTIASLRAQLFQEPSKEQLVRLVWLLGKYRAAGEVQDLAKRIDLEAEQPPGELREPPRWSKYPAQEALVKIGQAVVPFMLENLATSDDEEVRRLSAETIVSVIGRYADVDAATAQEWATQRLEQAIEKENDDQRRQRLTDALKLIEGEQRQ